MLMFNRCVIVRMLAKTLGNAKFGAFFVLIFVFE